MTVIVGGFLGPLLITGGYGGAGTPLLINQQLTCALIASSSSPTPWSIDPNQTQQLSDLTSPSETAWSESYGASVITTSSWPTPWSIDPEQTQQLT